MDGLTRKITEGDAAALKLVKTALTSPTLINTDLTQGQPYALALECEQFDLSGSAQVSESLLVTKNGKQNIADNVAPGAWTWDMSGYIPGNKILEPSNYYTPFVKLNTDILTQWFKLGAVLIFKDMDARIYKQVVIQSLRVSHQKDCANAAPFTMTLKEINVIEQNGLDTMTNLLEKGSKFGKALTVGVSIAALEANALAALIA